MNVQLRDPQLALRPMRETDLKAVLAIEVKVYEFPWTMGIFRDCLRAGYSCLIISLHEHVIGYGVFSLAVDECHLLNICIHPDWQGRGLGHKLMRRLIKLARQQGAENVFLEVRESNTLARALYRRMGFLVVGRRKDYYPLAAGREDALILSLEL
jgi:ribosomal-protein-alanine N-acetyltransferase